MTSRSVGTEGEGGRVVIEAASWGRYLSAGPAPAGVKTLEYFSNRYLGGVARWISAESGGRWSAGWSVGDRQVNLL